ncbi:DUF397 domain-containing protein [uncultured Streptomyces sp.]|uniref:DUF397 domain-containing protein n=1 Tax=uncultured Streptomyces sp. TaxID=174707 RepID=UPI0026383764|nr:DUF397 domain-containing protein [uncultured Streptomyces sp.]
MIHETAAGNLCALEWSRSSYSDSSSGNNCVEVAAAPGTIHVRDSKSVPGPRLAFNARSWAEFVPYAARS